MAFRSHLAALGAVCLASCTVVSVGAEDGPPRVESNGLIDGHAAVGIRDEHDFVRVRFLDGESDGALGEIVLWKLFRLEVGALGVGVGLGPFDLALGTLFYEPRVPDMVHAANAAAPAADAAHSGDDDCELCRKAKAAKE